MEDKIIIETFIEKIKEYAKGRTNDVKRGAETPQLAALLLQKYGYGIVDAVCMLQDKGMNVDTSAIFKVLDEEVEKIDPEWSEHAKKRWSGRPAYISIDN